MKMRSGGNCKLRLSNCAFLELDMMLKVEATEDGPIKSVLPKIRDMVKAMQNRDRMAAVQSGTQALDQLSNLE